MIRASLEQAEFSDCFKKNGHCIENKIFFVKNMLTKSMYGYTNVPFSYGNDICFRREMKTAFIYGLLYVLKPVNDKSKFIFKLLLQQADFTDMFLIEKELLENIVFYVDSIKGVQGPFSTNNFTPDRIYKGIEQGNIYIPCHEQNFELIQNQKIA